LVVSSFYPPNYVGGYELGCRDAVDGFLARGHDVTVLTSSYGNVHQVVDGHVHRKLFVSYGKTPMWKIPYREWLNQRQFRKYCEELRPDVVFFWKITDISMGLPTIAHELGFPMCYYIFDDWLAAWDEDQWLCLIGHSRFRMFYRLVAKVLSLKAFQEKPPVENVIFASDYLRQLTLVGAGPIHNSTIIPWGINPSLFSCSDVLREIVPSRLLYVGQIVRHKGVHVAIDAVARLIAQCGKSVSLTIVGDTRQDLAYYNDLKETIKRSGLEDCVEFAGKIKREQLPSVYRKHGILIFPSLWEEPFGITPLEAMACGLVVVSSGTGGCRETMKDGWSALFYDKEDGEFCASQILRLLRDARLFFFIRNNSSRLVKDQYNLRSTIESLEKFVFQAIC
jgi:glycosyltransferase involved in cell wall biosynthesis